MPSNFDPQKHHRRSIRLKGYDYSKAGAYFVTVVCQNRAALFGKIVDGEMVLNEAGQMVVAEWEAIVERFPHVELGIYVVMPNHFHAILIIRDITLVGAGLVPAPVFVPAPAPGEENIPLNGTNPGEDRATIKVAPTGKPPTLGQIIGAFKSITMHAYIRGVDEKGWARFDKRLWQRNYYERIIRNEPPPPPPPNTDEVQSVFGGGARQGGGGGVISKITPPPGPRTTKTPTRAKGDKRQLTRAGGFWYRIA